MEYIEEYNKKYRNISIILFILFQVILTFALSIFKKWNIKFLLNNANFICYVILFIIFFIAYRKIMIKSFKKIDKNNVKYFVIYLISTIISMVAIAIIMDKCGIVNTNEIQENDANNILNFITVVILGTFVEEFLFRYFVFREALKVNKIFAHIIAALVFGFSHIWYYVLIQGDYTQLFSSFVYIALGLNLSLLYAKTKNICYPLFLHMIINFISVT